MTFDPDTAHPTLSVSECCDSVWFEEDKDVQACPANPRRFHYYYCVFGHQGFSTGRHYWEVEVGGKTAWRLGVAREDVPRGEMASTGTSSGFWTLALKGGSILACTDPQPMKVTVSARLVRIGVFLDCEKEEVSFYNAVTMSPIYTFTMGTLTVPLFPYYNPCDTDDGRNTAAINIFKPSLWPASQPDVASLTSHFQMNKHAIFKTITSTIRQILKCLTQFLSTPLKRALFRKRKKGSCLLQLDGSCGVQRRR